MNKYFEDKGLEKVLVDLRRETNGTPREVQPQYETMAISKEDFKVEVTKTDVAWHFKVWPRESKPKKTCLECVEGSLLKVRLEALMQENSNLKDEVVALKDDIKQINGLYTMKIAFAIIFTSMLYIGYRILEAAL